MDKTSSKPKMSNDYTLFSHEEILNKFYDTTKKLNGTVEVNGVVINTPLELVNARVDSFNSNTYSYNIKFKTKCTTETYIIEKNGDTYSKMQYSKFTAFPCIFQTFINMMTKY